MKLNSQSGFTLIEVIVTLVTASVLGAMMYSYASSSFSQSSLPIARLKDSFELHAVMENIISDYENHLESTAQWEAGHAYVAGDIVTPTPTMKNGYHYVCVTAGTSHATTEPTWKTTWSAAPDFGVSDIADGSVIWKEALSTLENQVEANAYGTYSVVSDETKFIKFKPDGANFKEDDAGMADGDTATILKVTITNDEGGILTSLFTITD